MNLFLESMNHNNPYSSEEDLNCRYIREDETGVLISRFGRPPDSTEKLYMDFVGFSKNVLPCVFGQSLVKSGRFILSCYSKFCDEPTTDALCQDLHDFVLLQDSLKSSVFSSFIAVFPNYQPANELKFEEDLWRQLRMITDLDEKFYSWDCSVSKEPNNPMFSFSFASRAYFIVGLSSVASRLSRKFDYTSVVFNARYQFDELRERNLMEKFRAIIRAKDKNLQGDINPNLVGYDDNVSEAKLYSGRAVESGWVCPFHKN